jgi:hypothetical protein
MEDIAGSVSGMVRDVGATMLRFLDAYTFRARLFPAVIGAAPALAAVALLISWKTLELSNIVATIGLLVLIYALADWARKRGQDLQPGLYEQMGGKPSVTMMYRSDSSIDQVSKDRYRAFLATKINQTEPTAADETQNPCAANGFYELAGTWLRENTRDTKKFPILFNENVTYGFRRNLLGLKWAALALNIAVVSICSAILWSRAPISMSDDMVPRVIVVLVVATIHALYVSLVVKPQSVMAASRTYARQLILSCETLIAGQKPPRTSAKRKGNAA